MKLTKEEILEGNKLIACFMGLKQIIEETAMKGGGGYDACRYHESWDWSMAVVDNINAMGKGYNVAIFKTYISLTVEKPVSFGRDYHYSQSKNITPEQKPKEAMFRLLIDFIKWDNSQK